MQSNLHIPLKLFVGLVALLLTGCDMLEPLPYSVDIDGPVDLNSTAMAALESSGLKAPFSFAFLTDTQGSLTELEDAVEMIRKRSDISFILLGGDMTDFGLAKEFVWTRDILRKSGLPFLSVIGNHDCLGNGNNVFDYVFGPQNFSFNIDHTHFVGLNTVALEYDYSKPVPDLNFIDNDRIAVDSLNAAHPDSITHTIVIMHSQPGDEQFNNNVSRPFNYYIAAYPGMTPDSTIVADDKFPIGDDVCPVSPGETLPFCSRGLCLNGHNHHTRIVDIFGNGIYYYQCANLGKRVFFVFTITEKGYSYETVLF